MNKKITYMLSMLLASALFTSCKNSNQEFPDYEAGTTVPVHCSPRARTVMQISLTTRQAPQSTSPTSTQSAPSY